MTPRRTGYSCTILVSKQRKGKDTLKSLFLREPQFPATTPVGRRKPHFFFAMIFISTAEESRTPINAIIPARRVISGSHRGEVAERLNAAVC
jgi:hypothetical protein